MNEETKDLLPEVTKDALRQRERRARAKAASEAKELEPIRMTASQAAPVEAPAYIDPKEARRREVAQKIARERMHKAQMVTGKFLFNECPGGELKFPYREFPGDELVNYTMRHDQIYTIPLGVAQHLNDRCAYYEYQHNLDNGKAVDIKNMYIQSKVHRTSFIPLNFTADVGNFTGQSIHQVMTHNPQDTRFSLDSLGR